VKSDGYTAKSAIALKSGEIRRSHFRKNCGENDQSEMRSTKTSFPGSLSPAAITNGLKRLHNAFNGDDFTFIVNGTRVASTLMDAVLVSPTVADMLMSDTTACEFTIGDGFASESTFKQLRDLFYNLDATIDRSSLKSMISLCRAFGNTDLANSVICAELCESSDSMQINLCDFGALVRTLASDLDRFTVEQLALFDVETLRQMIGSDSLKISSEDWLLTTIIGLGDDYSSLLSEVHFEFLSPLGMRQFCDRYGFECLTEEIWEHLRIRLKGECDDDIQIRRFGRVTICPWESALDSKIVSAIPSILKEFFGKSIRLLYRGSRDSFGSRNFHTKCDGIGSTLTLIETSRHNIFGGYTPCVWSSTGGDVMDASGRTFLFTLKNPHNVSARKFTYVKGKKAIFCHSGDGPSFGGGVDIRVLDGAMRTPTITPILAAHL
jgi:hypothetical protein